MTYPVLCACACFLTFACGCLLLLLQQFALFFIFLTLSFTLFLHLLLLPLAFYCCAKCNVPWAPTQKIQQQQNNNKRIKEKQITKKLGRVPAANIATTTISTANKLKYRQVTTITTMHCMRLLPSCWIVCGLDSVSVRVSATDFWLGKSLIESQIYMHTCIRWNKNE